VQAARQNEMAFEQRARAPESFYHLVCTHELLLPTGALRATMPRG
jgi:hypothetical protein